MNHVAGGVLSDSGSAKQIIFENSTFLENYASGSGGVAWLQTNTNFDVKNCTFERNKSDNTGGVFCLSAGSKTTIEDSVIQNNTAYSGGAISVIQSPEITIKNTTITNNTAQRYGGAVYFTTYTRDASARQSTFTMAQGAKIYGNTAGVGGDDITVLYDASKKHQLQLLNARDMNAYTSDGVKITGWYYDTPDNYSGNLYADEITDVLKRFNRQDAKEFLDYTSLFGEANGTTLLFIKQRQKVITLSMTKMQMMQQVLWIHNNILKTMVLEF